MKTFSHYMISISCAPQDPDYNELTPEEKQIFGKMVNQYMNQGYNLKTSQAMALSKVLSDSIPFD